MKKSKRVVVISDTHCGHQAGLTPPGWQFNKNSSDKGRKNFQELQEKQWDWFSKSIKALGKIDILILNGDAIDGKGERSGTTEQLEPDMFKQADMAIEVVNFIQPTKTIMTYGTPYHTGQGEDVEGIIAKEVDADIKGHQFVDINGVIFDIKHKVGSSTVPHGRYTPIAREGLWNDLWSLEENGQPRSNVLIRSHVHYFSCIMNSTRLAMTTPALQGFGSKYGTRQCSGIVDIGFIHFDIEQEDYTWEHHRYTADVLKAQILQA